MGRRWGDWWVTEGKVGGSWEGWWVIGGRMSHGRDGGSSQGGSVGRMREGWWVFAGRAGRSSLGGLVGHCRDYGMFFYKLTCIGCWAVNNK